MANFIEVGIYIINLDTVSYMENYIETGKDLQDEHVVVHLLDGTVLRIDGQYGINLLNALNVQL